MDAFRRGFVFWNCPEPERLPPMPDDIEDLGERLSGFQQAYADYPDDPRLAYVMGAVLSAELDDTPGGRS